MLLNWRLIDTGPASAGWNMAVDEALLILAGSGGAPVLRFFSWEVPSLSIGSFQKVGELDMERIRAEKVPLVRRPTGGRAVLHDAEITYSVACPIESPYFPTDLMGSYKVIGACFLRGLKDIGVDASLVPVNKDPGRKAAAKTGHNPMCFSSPSWYEVLLGGKKLIGSAQRRLQKSFLQQGSLLMKLDIEGLLSLMAFGDGEARGLAAESLADKMTALGEHGFAHDAATVKAAIARGFVEELRATFVPDGLNADELELAQRLYEEKYGRVEWNLFRGKG